jgi:hypothetical protein
MLPLVNHTRPFVLVMAAPMSGEAPAISPHRYMLLPLSHPSCSGAADCAIGMAGDNGTPLEAWPVKRNEFVAAHSCGRSYQLADSSVNPSNATVLPPPDPLPANTILTVCVPAGGAVPHLKAIKRSLILLAYRFTDPLETPST